MDMDVDSASVVQWLRSHSSVERSKSCFTCNSLHPGTIPLILLNIGKGSLGRQKMQNPV